MRIGWIRYLFVIAGIYDGLFGLAFFFFGSEIYEAAHVTLPNHYAYLKFPALLLVLFGVMFIRVAQAPIRNREVMLYGVGLKASYAGVVFWYQTHGGVPRLFLPWAWLDIAFLIVFLLAWKRTAGLKPDIEI